MNEYGAYWQGGGTKGLEEEPFPVSLCPPLTSHWPARDRSRVSVVTGRWLTQPEQWHGHSSPLRNSSSSKQFSADTVLCQILTHLGWPSRINIMRAMDPREQAQSALLVVIRAQVDDMSREWWEAACSWDLRRTTHLHPKEQVKINFATGQNSSFPCKRTPITVTVNFGLLTHYMGSGLAWRAAIQTFCSITAQSLLRPLCRRNFWVRQPAQKNYSRSGSSFCRHCTDFHGNNTCILHNLYLSNYITKVT